MKALDSSQPPPDVPTGEWHDGLLLGYRPMDDTHQEFVALVTRLRTAPDDELPAVLDDFLAHIGRHFGEEEQWMSLDGYPAGDCHVEEHAAVMRSVLEVRDLVATGQRKVCRELAGALEEWFPLHAAYMDSALAKWMVKRSTGGSPVVLRRRTSSAG